jgi:vacuolar-type H+-ATPase subunit C/Vma6
MPDLGDLIARVRGLGAGLLGAAQLRALGGERDLVALADALARAGAISRGHLPGVTAGSLEVALRRRAGERLAIVARWAGARVELLEPLYDDEDRRSLRALVRGAVAGLPADARVAGLIPTPNLPLRALARLAGVESLAEIAQALAAWGSPFRRAFPALHAPSRPDLFRIECALTRAFAVRAAERARRADAPMRAFVERIVDIENLWTALALADGAADVNPDVLFVPGGALVRVDDLVLAATTRSSSALAAVLRRRVRRTPLGVALAGDVAGREARALHGLIAEFRRAALRDPGSTAPVIAFVLRQRAELRTLLRLVWGVAMGAPAARLAAGEAA